MCDFRENRDILEIYLMGYINIDIKIIATKILSSNLPIALAISSLAIYLHLRVSFPKKEI